MKNFLKILKHPLIWIILLGFSFRFYGVKSFPVLHDEIMSILDGVNKTKESLIHFFYIASLENTLGIMPFYFWVERLFTDNIGVNNWGLRVFPLISGILTIYLAYYVIKKRFNKNIALLSSFIVAFSDIFIWVTSKAQFFEVILVPLSFLIFFFLTSENKNKFYWSSLFITLMLFTYFGKGLFFLFCFFLWYALCKIFDLSRLKIKWTEIISVTKKELIQFSSFFLLPLVWIISAHFIVFSKGPIYNVVGLGKINNIWEILYLTTFGYGIHAKQFLAGSPRDAFLVFDNIHIWPITGLLFIPFLFGLVFLIYEIIIHWRKSNNLLFKRDTFLLIFALIPFLFIIFRGIISARFHLLYFLPFVVISSMGLSQVAYLFETNKNKILYPIFILTLGIYGSYISSWKNWYYFVFNWSLFYKLCGIVFGSIMFYCTIGFLIKINKKIFVRSFIGVFLFFLIIINFFFGPIVWGINAPWAPASDNKLNYLEGNEESIINFALKQNKPNICYKLPKNWKEICLDRFNQ
ncbi:MAG: glycosyltransferase family 39 protein [Candidatus Nealsonbacteria bacterium]